MTDTIVACATLAGPSAVAIVRLSGPRAFALSALLAPSHKPRTAHRLSVATVSIGESTLDDGMVVHMPKPRSYTGEDVVELHVHGSAWIVHTLLQECCRLGARLAEPGEFTLRAFLNGKLDLAQAEGVGALIIAQSENEHCQAQRLLQGTLSQLLGGWLGRLEAVLADWQAALDFPEYPTGAGLALAHAGELTSILSELERLHTTSQAALSGPTSVTFCGAPNVGKSTLINALLGEERVLVDDAPGTTRDPVEVALTDGARRVALWDTAGIRPNATGLEAKGIAMTHARMRKSDLCLWLVDAQEPVWPEVPTAVLCSKADLCTTEARSILVREAERLGLTLWGFVSPHSGEGVDALRRRLLQSAQPSQDTVVVRRRQLECLSRACAHLHDACAGLEAATPLDLVARDLQRAAKELGYILGRDVDLDTLNRIFATFCIGK